MEDHINEYLQGTTDTFNIERMVKVIKKIPHTYIILLSRYEFCIKGFSWENVEATTFGEGRV